MKKLPIGIQSFNEIITGGYVYADKTQYIYELIEGAKYYFLSRPRRFGKSLLLDTISEVFKGNRELFKELWIYDSGYGFEEHPVIRMDMSNIANETSEILKNSLLEELYVRIKKEGFSISDSEPGGVFKRLIENLYEKYDRRVVVLIDEYDKPILDHLHNAEMAESNRQVIKSFYGVLKSMDPHLRFTFLTGVSKFTKTSVFSELNNLKDITMTEKYAGICGIAVEDLELYFGDHMESLKELKRFRGCENLSEMILNWYDGYSWDGVSRVINPFSLLSFFGQERFGSFWYASGSPKSLVDMIKQKPESYLALKNLKINEMILDSVDINKLSVEPLLFQTGYLTVKEMIETGGAPAYLLELPNREVREAFSLQVLSALTDSGDAMAGRVQFEITDALEAGDLQRMLDMLRGLFASIPYELHVPLEAYYHSIFYAAMTLLGFDMDVEVSVSRGRVDAVLELGDKVYVMEFKYEKCPPDASMEEKKVLFNASLESAMKQINERGYSDRFQGNGKAIYHVAFAFLGRDEIEMEVRKS